MTDPREAKLPKWAQAELRSLRHRLDEARDAIAEVEMDREIVVVTEPYGLAPKPVAKENEAVRFFLEGYDSWKWLDVSVRDGRAHLMGSSGLTLRPNASNTLDVEVSRW